jgi:uncharacterized protein (DUF1499 family)
VSDTSRATKLAARPVAFGWALLLVGPLAASTGGVPPGVGFSLYVLGGGVAALSGLVGGWLLRRAAAPARGILVIGVLGLLPVLVPALLAAGAPPINDITTDPSDPPTLLAGRALEGAGLSMTYDPSFAPITREAYPDLAPLHLDLPASWVVDRAARCLETLGGAQVIRDPEGGGVQATFVTTIFRFRDDVAVRVRPAGDGARADVRSRSRVGKGDMGANAARVRAITSCLSAGV